jgi:hypothetical protein
MYCMNVRWSLRFRFVTMRPNNRRDLYSISLTRYGTVDPFEINGILALAQEMISLSLLLSVRRLSPVSTPPWMHTPTRAAF